MPRSVLQLTLTASNGIEIWKSMSLCAVAMLSKMGPGRLSRGRQMMPPLPTSWATLGQHMAAQQLQKAASSLTESRLPNKASSGKTKLPSKPPSAGLSEMAKIPSRPPSAGFNGKAEILSRLPATGPKSSHHCTDTAPRQTALEGGLQMNGNSVPSRTVPESQKGKASSNTQPRPAWGAPQPPANATQVAAARSYKV